MKRTIIRKTTEQYISDAKKIHGDKYDYSKVNYITCQIKIVIICKTHGDFMMSPNGHLNGSGCQKCGLETRNKAVRKTTEQYISDAKKIHGDKYDYSQVQYTTSLNPIVIICKIHGEFKTEPRYHTKGKGCPSCEGYIDTTKQVENSTDETLTPIPGFEGYLISRTGNVFSQKINNYLNINLDRLKKLKSRVYVCLYKDDKRKTVFLHRLVAITYLPNPKNKPEVNHKDGDYYNNNISNLEWVSKKENMDHAKFNRLFKPSNTGRTILQYDMDNNFIREFYSIRDASKSINILSTTISKVLVGQLKQAGGFIWKYKPIEDIENEVWKNVIIDNIDTGYYISNQGRVKNKNRILKGSTRQGGYIVIDLTTINKSYPIHRLVALMFIPNPTNKPYVDHIDCNPVNNKVENLRWTTQSNENTKKKYNISVQQLDNDKNIINTFKSIKEASEYILEKYNIQSHINTAIKEPWRKAGGFFWKLTEK